MEQGEITAEDYAARLKRLCAGPTMVRNFPRGGRDRAVLLKAASLYLEPALRYTEREVTDRLSTWLAEVGSALRTDAVTLRRHLVDYGYLDRDPAGRSYWVLERSPWRFPREVAALDQRAVTDH